MNRAARTIITTLIISLTLLIILSMSGQSGSFLNVSKPERFNYSQFREAVETGRVATAEWRDDTISGELKTKSAEGRPQRYEAKVGPSGDGRAEDLSILMESKDVTISYPDPPISPFIQQLFIWTFPILLMVALFYFLFYRPSQQGGNQAMNFGRSKARRASETNIKVTFDDVAGIEEAKQELFEIVDFLRSTKKYVALGAKIPKGILLTGPPGVGKTHLARAIAGEAGVPFFHISGSDFVEMFVGVGAARVRDLFETAKAHRPCLIFVDEIDAVGRQRGAGLGGGHDEREQTLNQLLVEMDGFDPNMGVIMIAATNRPDVLDPALLRPGRFDRQIVVDTPDAKGREAILRIHSKGKPMEPDLDLAVVAKRTPGFTGADLANTLNEAALLSARINKTKISMAEVEEALDRVMVGPARRSKVMLPKDREITAYHEAGHAIVGELLEHCDPVHKVTILPRGMALGLTWTLPQDEYSHMSRSKLLDMISMTLGGLVAEEVVYGERWTGASSDLDRVTRIGRAMVCEYGMSERLGTLAIGRRNRSPFLGRDVYEDRDYSEEVARMVDEEVRGIVDRAHQRATEILQTHRAQLDELVRVLLDRETIDREEFLAVLEGRPLPAQKSDDSTTGGTPAVDVPAGDVGFGGQSGKLEPGTA